MENLKLVRCQKEHWEFIRKLRTDPRNIGGFVKTAPISVAQQKAYMKKYQRHYYVCLHDLLPVGFIGSIDGDLRVCTDHQWKGKGIAKFMVNEFAKRNKKKTFAKVKVDNKVSQRLFQSCGFELKFLIYEKRA